MPNKSITEIDGTGLPGNLNGFIRNFEAEIGTYSNQVLAGSVIGPAERMAAILIAYRNPAAVQNARATLHNGLDTLSSVAEEVVSKVAATLALAPTQSPQPQPVRAPGAPVRKPTFKGKDNSGPV